MYKRKNKTDIPKEFTTPEYRKMLSRINTRRRRNQPKQLESFERLKQNVELMVKHKPNYYLNMLEWIKKN